MATAPTAATSTLSEIGSHVTPLFDRLPEAAGSRGRVDRVEVIAQRRLGHGDLGHPRRRPERSDVAERRRVEHRSGGSGSAGRRAAPIRPSAASDQPIRVRFHRRIASRVWGHRSSAATRSRSGGCRQISRDYGSRGSGGSGGSGFAGSGIELEAPVQLPRRQGSGERRERAALGDLLRCFEEAAPRARASAPPTLMRRTPASASSRTVAKPLELASTLTGFGATAPTMARTSSSVRMSRGVQAVGAGVGERGQPADRFREVGPPDEKAFGASGQDHVGAARVNRASATRARDRRPARTRTSGADASPVESSIDSPATPVATAAETLRPLPRVRRRTRPRSPRSSGRSTPLAIVFRCASTPASGTCCRRGRATRQSRRWSRQGLKPSCARTRALPRSQGFGMTKQPASWRIRKARRRSVAAVMAAFYPSASPATLSPWPSRSFSC